MPLTFPAHQSFVIGLKFRWPRHIDATALCIGAAAPDLAYPLGDWLNHQSHALTGVVVWAIPVTLVAATLVRWRAGSGIFAHVPDMGPLRLRSYQVLSLRRPGPVVTFVSAVIGAGSHVVIDAFTHRSRWGAQWLGLDRVVGTVPIRGEFTWARVLQYLGHTVGSTAFVLVIIWIASRGRLERWYGSEAVRRVRQVQVSGARRVVFWSLVLAPVAAAVLSRPGTTSGRVFLPILGLFVGFLVAGVVMAVPPVPGGCSDVTDAPEGFTAARGGGGSGHR